MRLVAVSVIGGAMPAAAFGFPNPSHAENVSPEEARAIAKDAYLYGFPMVDSYETLYAQAVDEAGANFKVPFNEIGNTANVFTPKDTAIITPTSGAPHGFTHFGSDRYQKRADDLSWDAFTDFLAEILAK
jgi:hypothetical protein